MISSTLVAAAGFFTLLPSALGLPQNANTKIPAYCDPGEPYDYDKMWWDDQSSACQAAGVATNCCVTFSGSGSCDVSFDSTSVSDLESAVGQQITKDGQFKTTAVGKWVAGYGTFYDDQPNPDVLSNWFHSISTFAGDSAAQSTLGWTGEVFFGYIADGVTTQIFVTPQG